MKKLLIITITIASFICLAPKSHATYSFYRSITVTSTASVASGTNANFPMLVSSTLTSWESSSTGGGARIQNLVNAPSGQQEPADLIFVTSTPTASGSNWSCGTSLNFETEKYTSSTGALIDWVNVPSVSTGTVIYACYGDATVTTDQSHPSSTWNSNYAAVYHLRETGTGASGDYKDSTLNANNSVNTTNQPTATSSEIDGGQSFSGVQNIKAASSTSLAINGAWSEEAWVYPVDNSNYEVVLLNYGTGTGRNYGFWLAPDATHKTFYVQGGNSASIQNTTIAYTMNAWNQVAVTQNTNGDLITYVNGVADDNGNLGTTGASGAGGDLYMGYDVPEANYQLNGNLDEAKVSTVVLSSQWITTEYNNESSPSTFYAIGSETAGSGGGTTTGEGAILFSVYLGTSYLGTAY